jgi:hypothetical protein
LSLKNPRSNVGLRLKKLSWRLHDDSFSCSSSSIETGRRGFLDAFTFFFFFFEAPFFFAAGESKNSEVISCLQGTVRD